ncbi:MAG: hypothetical protein IJV70_03820, partial [Clostridia bacterium]|nr:hypothetical protein [Clostridia bacterium]
MRKRLLFALITISTCFAIFTSCNEQPHEHLFDEWVTIKQADCYETGLQKSICECGKLDFRELEKLPHTEAIYEAIEPTCTSIGLTEGKYCSVCNTVLVTQTPIAAKEHTPVTDAAVAPTCTSIGLTEGKHCSVCSTVLVAQTPVAAKGHTAVIDAAVAPTCTSIGLTEGNHCSACNTVLVAQTAVAPQGHKYSQDIVSGKNLKSLPTCTEAAIYYEICACGARSGNTFANGSINRENHTSTVIVHEYAEKD